MSQVPALRNSAEGISALSSASENNAAQYQLLAAREQHDAFMRTVFSTEKLTQNHLWIDMNVYLNDPEQRIAFDQMRVVYSSVLFSPLAEETKSEIQRELSTAGSTTQEQEYYFLTHWTRIADNIAKALLHSAKNNSGVARNSPHFANLIATRIYSELFDVGLYMVYSYTDAISNIHIIGTRMFCYRSDGSTWFALIPAAADWRKAVELANYYGRHVNKRFDLGFPHNNLDSTRQHRIAVRQTTVQTDGFVAAIRLHRAVHYSPIDMINSGFISVEATNFIHRCVYAALPGLITGAPGSAKTTFLRTLTSAIPRTDPIFSVEYAPELFLDTLRHPVDGLPYFSTLHCHVVQGANAEGVGSIPFDEIFKWGLQEDVRRMIIGELADPESMLTFINALQTGQSGALATLHAQSVADTVTRVAQLLSSYYDRSVAWEYLGQNLRFIVHCQVVRSSTQERRFVTGVGWLDFNPNTVHDSDRPPLVHHVFERDFRTGELNRGPGFEEAMRQLCDAEDHAFGSNFGLELSNESLMAFGV